MGYGSLAPVYTGWTGTLVYSDGTYTVTITPHTRESVASIVARLVRDVLVTAGVRLTVSVSSGGVITIAAGSVFALTVTLVTATRSGFTGTYTGAVTYTAAGAFSNGWVPANGLRLADPMLATSRGGVVGDGSAGGSPMRTSATSTLIAWNSAIALPDLTGEQDYWHDGRVFGRLLVTGVRRVPLSSIRTVGSVRVELDVIEVT